MIIFDIMPLCVLYKTKKNTKYLISMRWNRICMDIIFVLYINNKNNNNNNNT